MSTKTKIQKVRNEVQAHEDRGWLKGYEEGLAVREEEVVAAQNALKARKDQIRELKHQKNGPKTAREALDLAWELAHPVKEGDVIPKGTDYLVRYGKGERPATARTGSDRFASEYDEARARTLDPLPEPTPDWLDAPAVIAFVKGHGGDPQVFSRENKTGTQWLRDTKVYRWDELTVVTPLYQKGQDE